MIVNIYDTSGNDYGSWDNTIDRVETYMPITIDCLANERGFLLTTHGEPLIREIKREGLNYLEIRKDVRFVLRDNSKLIRV
jgi:hypothetical protein